MMDHLDMRETADITQDGHLVGISARREMHPLYKTDAVDAKFTVALNMHQFRLADMLMHGHPGTISFSLRSALAQLGIDAFHPDTTSLSFDGIDHLTATTLVTHLDAERSEPVFVSLQKAVLQKKNPAFSRVSLLPDQAIIPGLELEEAITQGRLEVSPHAEIGADGTLLLPPEEMHHHFDDALRTPESLENIISGSARSAIKAARRSHPHLPTELHAREFLVTDVHIHTPIFHVVLDNMTVVQRKISSIVHSAAFFLDAGRTVKESGDRQLELWNANGAPVPTKDIRVVARAYKPSVIVPGAI